MGDALLAQDAVEHDLGGPWAVATTEDLAVVGQDLIGDAVALKGGEEHVADGPRDRPVHEPAGDAEAAVVIDPGDQLEVGAVVQEHARHDVHLPELHRPLALPAAELLAALPAAAQLDQPVALQAAVDRRA